MKNLVKVAFYASLLVLGTHAHQGISDDDDIDTIINKVGASMGLEKSSKIEKVLSKYAMVHYFTGNDPSARASIVVARDKNNNKIVEVDLDESPIQDMNTKFSEDVFQQMCDKN